MKKFIEDGFYSTVENYSQTGESLIQKTLTTQIRTALLDRGIRGVDIQREIELDDGKEIDYFISYGLIGRILIEVKLTHNGEVYGPKKRVAYKKKMLHYVQATKSTHGIFLIFQIKKDYLLGKYLPSIKKIYVDYPNIAVMGFNCLL